MENKVRINVEEEKVLRLSIPSENGTIVINNPSQKFKNDLINVLITFITKNEDFDERKIMTELINHCTNVEFEGDLFEATYLSHEAQMITNEILIIFQELISEAYQVIKLAMQQAKNEMLQKEILKEKDEIVDIDKQIKEEKVEEGIKEVSHKTVRKMPRRRK